MSKGSKMSMSMIFVHVALRRVWVHLRYHTCTSSSLSRNFPKSSDVACCLASAIFSRSTIISWKTKIKVKTLCIKCTNCHIEGIHVQARFIGLSVPPVVVCWLDCDFCSVNVMYLCNWNHISNTMYVHFLLFTYEIHFLLYFIVVRWHIFRESEYCLTRESLIVYFLSQMILV